MLLANTFLLFSQLNYDNKIVSDIIIEGNQTINEKLILKNIGFSVGDAISNQQIRNVIKRINASRFFEDISLSIEEVSESEIVVFLTVKERITINKLIFVGNDHLRSSKIKEDNPITEVKYYNQNDINQGRLRVIETYLQAGFLDVQVEVETVVAEANAFDVYFIIDEGSRYLVKEINFFNISKKEIKQIKRFIDLKEHRWHRRGYFNYNQLMQDRQKIILRLKSFGYYRAQIMDIAISYEWRKTKKKDEKFVTIDVDILPGEKYFFGDVRLRGNNIFSDDELIADFKREKGEIYNEITHLQDIQSIYFKYRNNGYIFSRITPLDSVDEENKQVNYLIDIYEGQIGHIENIYIEGLGKTKKNVVERELLFSVGETFNLSKINGSLRNLSRLDYFSLVSPNYRIGSTEGLMDIYLSFQEKRTTVFSAGFGYGFNSGFSLIGELKDNNFLGYGYSFGVKTSVGVNVKDFKISFEDPWFLDYPVALGGSFSIGKYYRDFNTEDNSGKVVSPDGGSRGVVNNESDSIQYTRDIVSASITSAQRFLSWIQIRETLSINYVKSYLQDFTVWPEKYTQLELYEANKSLFDEAPPHNTRLYYTFSLLLQRDNRNSIINPTDGEIISLNPTFYFGDFSLTNWNFNFGVYRSIAWNFSGLEDFRMKLVFVYKNNLRTLGKSLSGEFVYDEINYLAITERDITGWEVDDIRDFRKQRYGSGALFTDNDYPLGQATFSQNFEIRQNIFVDLIQIVFFLDMAAISNKQLSFSDFSTWDFIFNWKNYMYSTGFGIRLNIPQLPIRFYFSWKFIYDQNSNTFRAFNQTRYRDNVNYRPDFSFDIQTFF